MGLYIVKCESLVLSVPVRRAFYVKKNSFVLYLTLAVSSWGGEEDGCDGCSTLIRYPKHKRVYKNEK